MVGIVVAAHGHLAEELVSTARGIVGELTHTTTCSVQPGAALEDIRAQMKRAVEAVDTGEGVLVLVDLLGGSPCTQGLTLCTQTRTHLEVVSGVNLPMLLKAASLRAASPPLGELAQQLVAYGQRTITIASELLRAQTSRPPAA